MLPESWTVCPQCKRVITPQAPCNCPRRRLAYTGRNALYCLLFLWAVLLSLALVWTLGWLLGDW